MIRIALDLELTQPENSIISIGAVAFDTETGEIKDKFHEYVYTEDKVSDYITQLTGITQSNVNNAQNIDVIYQELVRFKEKNDAHTQLVTWGAGDMKALKDQVYRFFQANYSGPWEQSNWWKFGYTEMNVKNINQAILEAKGLKTQGGLKTSMRKAGVPFEGPAHSADMDALNTAKFYCYFLNKLKGLV